MIYILGSNVDFYQQIKRRRKKLFS